MAATAETQEIIDRVRIRIAEPEANMIQDTDLAKLITECQRDLLWRLPDAALWPVTSSKSTTISAGTASYIFEAATLAATGFVRELLVKWKVTYARRLEKDAVRKIAGISDRTPSDTCPYYIIEEDGITFEVTTVTQSNSDVFVIDYIKTPADIDIGASAVGPEFPQSYFGPIEDFVVSRCWEQRGVTDERDRAYQSYLERIQNIAMAYIPGLDVNRYEPVPGRRV